MLTATTAAPSVQNLPTPLLLLVHLHILEYPHANSPEYDHNVFNQRTRGLRERAKTMEDVAYFLVGRVEGNGVKALLSTYPCTQPAESLAFRTSLTKYLESLRHRCIYPSSTRSSAGLGNSGRDGLKSSSGEAEAMVAWWWKDVVVRKSLLEECSGNKFERLLLSLSTHALMKTSCPISPTTMSSLLRSQPIAYTTALARSRTIRHGWTRSSSLLLRQEHDLQALRKHIEFHDPLLSPTFSTFSTARLQALADSKLQELLNSHWHGKCGRTALLFLVDLVGFRSSSSSQEMLPLHADIPSPPTYPSPLPIAAAHHPAHLKKLRKPVFQPKSQRHAISATYLTSSSQSHAEILLAAQIENEKRMRQALSDALSRCKKRGHELGGRFNSMLNRSHPAPSASKVAFWTYPPEAGMIIDLDPEPSKELMTSLGLDLDYEMLNSAGEEDDALEIRIDEIRTSVLPPYPPIPDPNAPRLPPQEVPGTREVKSRIPLTKATSNLQNQIEATRSKIPLAPASSLQVPQTPSMMSPSKSSSSRSIRRKSVRFSMARRRTTGRPSMFGAFIGMEDEVDRLIDETHDFTTDDDDTDHESGSASSPYKTPKAKRKTPKVNRIWTAGTPMSQSTKRSMALTRLFDIDPELGLPSHLTLGRSTSSISSDAESVAAEDSAEERDANGHMDVDATPMPLKRAVRVCRPVQFDDSDEDDGEGREAEGESADEEDVFGDDPPSMTLKDILLSADTSHFDLLEVGEGLDLEDGLVEDTSFVWE